MGSRSQAVDAIGGGGQAGMGKKAAYCGWSAVDPSSWDCQTSAIERARTHQTRTLLCAVGSHRFSLPVCPAWQHQLPFSPAFLQSRRSSHVHVAGFSSQRSPQCLPASCRFYIRSSVRNVIERQPERHCPLFRQTISAKETSFVTPTSV